MGKILTISPYKSHSFQNSYYLELAINRLYKNELIIDVKTGIKDFVESISPLLTKARVLKKSDLNELLNLIKEDFERFECDLLLFDEDLLCLRNILEDLENLNTSRFDEDINIINKIVKDIDDLQKDCENIESDVNRLNLANCSEKRLKQLLSTISKCGAIKNVPRLVKLLSKITQSLIKIAKVMNQISKNRLLKELKSFSKIDITDMKKDLDCLLEDFKTLAA